MPTTGPIKPNATMPSVFFVPPKTFDAGAVLHLLPEKKHKTRTAQQQATNTYSLAVQNMLDFGDSTNALQVTFLPCKKDGSGHAPADPITIGTISFNKTATLKQIPFEVPNTAGGAPCIQNVEALGPPTQWGSPYCTLDNKAMKRVWKYFQGGHTPLLRVGTTMGPPGLSCTMLL